MTQAWWHGAVFYEIYVRSFADSNNDGIGDLSQAGCSRPAIPSSGWSARG
jgi:hypothetical protein